MFIVVIVVVVAAVVAAAAAATADATAAAAAAVAAAHDAVSITGVTVIGGVIGGVVIFGGCAVNFNNGVGMKMENSSSFIIHHSSFISSLSPKLKINFSNLAFWALFLHGWVPSTFFNIFISIFQDFHTALRPQDALLSETVWHNAHSVPKL